MGQREDTARAMRGKILGVLLKDARLAAGKTPGECADVLSCTLAAYNAYEQGRKPPSLPELELLAYYFNVPVTQFWGGQTLSGPDRREAAQLPAPELTELRHRIIGTKIRQARLALKLKPKDFATHAGLTTAQLSAYETGKKPIPIPDLDALMVRLGLTLDDLLERQGPIGQWDSVRRDMERLRQMPDDLREFIVHPANETYLRLAQRLSEASADKLRGIAESLLDITY
jgi:transcriptional regulator with XRE-family HTH domain